MAVEKLKINH